MMQQDVSLQQHKLFYWCFPRLIIRLKLGSIFCLLTMERNREKRGGKNRENRDPRTSECRKQSRAILAAEVMQCCCTGNEVAPGAKRGRSNTEMGQVSGQVGGDKVTEAE